MMQNLSFLTILWFQHLTHAWKKSIILLKSFVLPWPILSIQVNLICLHLLINLKIFKSEANWDKLPKQVWYGYHTSANRWNCFWWTEVNIFSLMPIKKLNEDHTHIFMKVTIVITNYIREKGKRSYISYLKIISWNSPHNPSSRIPTFRC